MADIAHVALGGEPGLPRLPPLAVPGRRRRRRPTSCASTSTPRPGSRSRWCARRPPRCARSSPSSASRRSRRPPGNRGLHLYVRVEPGWDSFAVRQAAVSVAREMERRRPDLITGAWWKEERGDAGVHRLQPERAPQDGVRRVVRAGARRRPGVDAVRAGTSWPAIHPDELTIATVPERARGARRPVGGDRRRAAVDRAARRALPRRPRRAGSRTPRGRRSTRRCPTRRRGSRRAGPAGLAAPTTDLRASCGIRLSEGATGLPVSSTRE